MPNLDGIIWQNPTVMESLAPIISDVTKRMEDTIKDKAKQDLALQVKNQEMEYRKKIAEQKLKTENAKKAGELPTSIPRTMLDHESKLLQQAQEDFYRRFGATGLKLNEPAAIDYANEWNQIQGLRVDAEKRHNNYMQQYEKAGVLDVNEYDGDPYDFVAGQMVEDEEYFQNALAEGKSWKDIYANYKRSGYELPKKKAPELQIKSEDLPKFVIENFTKSVTNRDGSSSSDTIPVEKIEDFENDLKNLYEKNLKPETVRIMNDRFKKDDGSIDFKAAAQYFKPYAGKENRTIGETDRQPRDKVVVNVNNPTPRGYSSGKTAKKKRAEGVSYEPQSLKSSQKGTTFPVWYQAEGETLPPKITQVALLSDKNNRKIHVLDATGAPVGEYPELDKVSNVVYWMPIADNGYLRRSINSGKGVAPHQVAGFSVVPYAQYKAGTEIYYVPATAIDSEYEIIEEGDAKEDQKKYEQGLVKKKTKEDKEQKTTIIPKDKKPKETMD